MMGLQLAQAAHILNADPAAADVRFEGISTDTRSLQPGNLFVALRGPNFNGEDYLAEAQRKGAVGAAVQQHQDLDLPQLEVADTRIALGQLAAHWRRRFSIPLVGITGSNGKTTVKEMVAAILSCRCETLVTQGNLNNDIGVPQTLFRLGVEHGAAVIEMGANHPGEIAYLTDIAEPTVGLVNNAGPSHLEGFGTLLGVAEAKGELFQHLPPDAVAVINAEDRFAPLWRKAAANRAQLSFGIEGDADVSAQWQGDAEGSDIELSTPQGTVALHLTLPGRHNVMNALAASAAALAAGAELAQLARGLESLRPVAGRLQRIVLADGSTLIDDTYNANPASLRVGLEVLRQCAGETWLVLGDMGELGPQAELLHQQMGKLVREAGIDRLFALGELAAAAAKVFGDGAVVCHSMDELNAAVADVWRPGVSLLVKGSRRMGMERVVRAVIDKKGEAS